MADVRGSLNVGGKGEGVFRIGQAGRKAHTPGRLFPRIGGPGRGAGEARAGVVDSPFAGGVWWAGSGACATEWAGADKPLVVNTADGRVRAHGATRREAGTHTARTRLRALCLPNQGGDHAAGGRTGRCTRPPRCAVS